MHASSAGADCGSTQQATADAVAEAVSGSSAGADAPAPANAAADGGAVKFRGVQFKAQKKVNCWRAELVVGHCCKMHIG